MIQKNIPDYLKENNIRPSSLSSVEKSPTTLKNPWEYLIMSNSSHFAKIGVLSNPAIKIQTFH
jgi:hypothetical protein